MKMEPAFTEGDVRMIREHGLSPEQVSRQLEIFSRGSFYHRLDRPATAGDGILVLPGDAGEKLFPLYAEQCREGRIMKFVPASGAASRMFRDWSRLCRAPAAASIEEFGRNLKRFAFFPDLEKTIQRSGMELQKLIEKGDYATILEFILDKKGLNYLNLPKALLKFHWYPDGNRTSMEEHLVEAAMYVRDGKGACRIHFTVSAEHRLLFEKCLEEAEKKYAEFFRVRYESGVSIQDPATDTVALDSKNRLLREDSGALVFRPGGHGSLLKNLNELRGDIVLIKNIDNIPPDRLKERTVVYKKLLGGYLILLQDRIRDYLNRLSGRGAGEGGLVEMETFCTRDLNIVFPEGFRKSGTGKRKQVLYEKLNRPLRVCGMVRNEGEPGGGPFWVEEEDGTRSLQIVEEAQVDPSSDRQKRIWESSSYFNPVDLACGLKDFRGEPFDLEKYINPRTYFISAKSQDGLEIKALEHPGLWNGGMARWNTVFIEVPIETFNPVKTVEDLLRPQHL